MVLVLATLGAILVGCGADTAQQDDRQFANEKSTESPAEPTRQPVTPDGVVPTKAVPTALPPDAADRMLAVADAPESVMVRSGNRLAVIDPLQPADAVSVDFTASWELLDFAPSPAGGRLVGLLRGPEGDLAVELRNTRAELLGKWDLSAWTAEDATLAPAIGSEAGFAISWTGDDDRVLTTLAGTRVVSIDLAGDAESIRLPSGIGNLVEASWSPTGDRIAMLGIGADGSGVVSLVSPYVDGESFRQVIPPAADAANLGSVTQFAWLPDGSGLVYILARNADATNPGGNLYRLDLQTRQRTVVATPGRGGPSAQIVDFAVAPDGSAVSYVIVSPTADVWTYHSLWIRSLSTALHLQVDTPDESNVSGMSWIGPGFVWRSTIDDRPVLFFTDQRTERIQIWDATTQDEATPIAASPALASPVAVPSGSPAALVATPVTGTPSPVAATPAASPIGSPASTPISLSLRHRRCCALP